MATITSSGIGSGLDIEGLVTQLVAAERRAPEARLDAKQESAQTRLSAYGLISSALNSLQSAFKSLNNPALLTAVKATVSNDSVLGTTVTGTPAPGAYSVEVMQMAQGQRVMTSATAAPSVAAGTLTFNLGRYTTTGEGEAAVTTFTATTSHTITLEPGKDSLADLRDAINGANIGITASIVNNGTTDQLVIARGAEGANAAFTMTGTDGLSAFTYDASTAAPSSNLDLLDAAQDAKVKFGGIELSRASNTISDLIDGVTLNLFDSAPGERIRINVTNDHAGARTAINDMVKAYNEAMTTMKSLTAFVPASSDKEENQAGVLQGDSTARNLMQTLRQSMSEGVSELGRILGMSVDGDVASLGISIGRDGMITLDNGKLDTALGNASADLSKVLTGSDGFAKRMENLLSGYLNSTSGILTSRSANLQKSLTAIDDERTRLDQRMEVIETRYRLQFSALDSMIASMQTTSSYITQMVDSLSAMNTKKK